MTSVRNYVVVTAAYWAFTLTDGALRMLVLLHFHQLGYSPVQLAFLFLSYELCGVITNLAGGWIAARTGLRATLLVGLALQIVALAMLTLPATLVMGAQALSGVAKDLTKMSAKSAIKVLVPEGAHSRLFRWVAVLTGSKNALKGVGFFLGGALLATLGYRGALIAMAAGVGVALVGAALALPRGMGKPRTKRAFTELFSRRRDLNVLSAARFFLFGARDLWFVVGVPVFLSARLGWSFTEVGGFLAAWVIGYGAIQAVAPAAFRRGAPSGRAAQVLAFALALVMAASTVAIREGVSPGLVVVLGLGLFGVVFALNSAVHSYLVLAYADDDEVAADVGFYYMANAGGRLVGTLLSGAVYQRAGLVGCLAASTAFALASGLLATRLPRGHQRVENASVA